MAIFKDVHKVGNSEIVPFRENEYFKDRHNRRKETNLEYQNELENWCNENGWYFAVKNNGHHWIFEKRKTMIEWWPSTAKLIKNKKWKNGYHCHDYTQVIAILEKTK